MANGDNLPYQDLDVVPFTPITSEWGDGIGDDILALAAGTGLDDNAVTSDKIDFDTGIWWEELGRITAGSDTTTMSLDIDARKVIHVLASVENNHNGGNNVALRFNGQSGASAYARRHVELPNAGTPVGLTTDTSNITIAVMSAANNHSYMEYIGDGISPGGGQWLKGIATASGGYNHRSGYSSTKSSTSVTNVSLVSVETNGIKAGSTLIVLGHN